MKPVSDLYVFGNDLIKRNKVYEEGRSQVLPAMKGGFSEPAFSPFMAWWEMSRKLERRGWKKRQQSVTRIMPEN